MYDLLMSPPHMWKQHDLLLSLHGSCKSTVHDDGQSPLASVDACRKAQTTILVLASRNLTCFHSLTNYQLNPWSALSDQWSFTM
ncbi:hypothetical protein TIFTF001_001732 [Ficus carica]|uniref:Uncharacterized protein n=1 Tax=Ficus carica TaxID=3494 RepID=A0AA88CRU5_FICCA|nr:hypothetical protein TIFTF001_001732 [Ficus carica]